MDEAVAIAALIALGLDPQLATAMVAHWAAEAQARKVEVYGLRLSRSKAELLKEKVAAVKAQVKKKLMGIEAARATLHSFGLPAATIEALLSAWDAEAYKQVISS